MVSLRDGGHMIIRRKPPPLKKDKKTDNHLQTTTQKSKDAATRFPALPPPHPQKPGVNSCSNRDTRHVSI